jgi:hypothetical protein
MTTNSKDVAVSGRDVSRRFRFKWTIPAAMKLPQRRGIYNIHAPGFADEYVPEQVPSILELAVNAHIFLSA